MRVFLTGGTGFIGRPLARRLIGRGWTVIGLVRNPSGPEAQSIHAHGVHLVPGDVTDRASMRAAMTGADMVIHNAAWYELGLTAKASQLMRRINVDGTENVLSLAQELGVPRVVYVSSLIAFGETGNQVRDETFERQAAPTSAYEQTKTEAHAIALAYQRRGLPLLIACPGNVIGPDDHAAWGYYARLYVNGLMPPMAWAQESIFAHASVGDTAEGIALVAERGHPGETYFLGGDLITMKEVLSLWSTTPGGLKRRLWVPTAIAAATFAPLEPLQRLLGIPAFSSRESARGAATTFAYSNAKARQALGWNPRPPREVWLETLRVERELRARRKKRDLASLLLPLGVDQG